MTTSRYSQTSRDRLAANVFVAIPVAVLLCVIRYFQVSKPPVVEGDDPALPL